MSSDPIVSSAHAREVVEPAMAEVLRRMTPAGRLDLGVKLWRHARQLLEAHLASTHPEWTAERRDLEVAERLAHGSW
jgi:hypothetical protein